MINQKVSRIAAAVKGVAKSGENTHYHYSYMTENDVLRAVRGPMIEEHLIIYPSVRSVSKDADITTAIIDFTIVDVDDGEERTLTFVGAGQDPGDKGIYKAYTGAVKYLLAKLFMLPTGDDPERDDTQQGVPERHDNVENDQAPYKPQVQAQTWQSHPQVKTNGAMTDKQRKAILAILRNNYGIDSHEEREQVAQVIGGAPFEELSAKQASKILTTLQSIPNRDALLSIINGEAF